MNKFTPLIVLVVLTLSINIALAANLEIEKIDRGSVVIRQLDNPSIFDFNITNPGSEELSQIYTLVSVTMFPREKFTIPEGQSFMEIKAVANPDFRERAPGLLNVEYQIKGEETGIFKDKLLLKMIDLEDVFEFTFQPISPEDTQTSVKIKNLENAHILNQEMNFGSVFFSVKENLTFTPNEEKEITLKLDKIGKKVTAGSYITTIMLPHAIEGETTFTESVEFLEKEATSVSQDSSGVIIRETVSSKTNTGNVYTLAKIEITKGIVARLLTTTSPEPTLTERSRFSVTYTWEKNLAPTEGIIVTTKTNYTIPFIILLIIIVVALLVYFSTRRAISLSKSVSLVRTKGGEFALKVNIKLRATRSLEKVHLTDTIPRMTKLFDRFGKKPDKIDHHNRRLTWDFGDLDKGEVRVVSYIIYSKMDIIGRFELPAALATFHRDGKIKDAYSNRTSFAKEESD